MIYKEKILKLNFFFIFSKKRNCISQKDVSSVGCSSICWNQNIYDPQTLVVGCYYDGNKNNINELIQIYGYSDTKKEYVLLTCLDSNGHTDSITDVQWAAQFGRTYHMIATSSKDGKIIIWKILLEYDYANDHFDNISVKYSKFYQYNHLEDNRDNKKNEVKNHFFERIYKILYKKMK